MGRGAELPAAPAIETSARCEPGSAIEEPYVPPGCAYLVDRAALLRDVRPSCGAATDEGPSGVHLTFPHPDPRHHVAVSWTTSDRTRVTEVQLGTKPEVLEAVHRGHSFSYPGLEGRVVHEVHLCGLEAATTYYYRAGGPGAWSEVASFVTAPADEGPFAFAVVGDTRSVDFSLWRDALEQIAAEGVDLLLFAGDAVDLGLIQSQWDAWFEAGQPYLASLPLIPANGNHDLVGVHWFAQFALPRNEQNFSYRYGDTLLIAMTDTNVHEGGVIEGRARTFLEQTLTANADARWKIMVNHRAFYSASMHGQSPDLLAEWRPLLDTHGVNLVFNGHDHNYERTKPLRDDRVVGPEEGAVYVVTSGVGAPLYGSGTAWWTELSASEPNYCIVRVDTTRIEVTAHRLDGSVLDRFTIPR